MATLAAHFRNRAIECMREGRVEDAWYFHGCADRAENVPLDPEQGDDPLYGADYRQGYTEAGP